ncbi:L-rhamnose mutarotase [Salinibacterium sp. NG22]|uniref:L-rhamnose mutarotase n=1 Tax=Salinibacterium sp. NG22 TaxID=2792040 RepID=UPI0018CDE2A4|nr:L-rhamnose mutarotase [Salinibacterium sp. NG22]MBH0110123.1 L-rhamnose mutarotase [Salinibacterium sp. NG22]
MKRVAQVIGLPPESREEYERYHAAVWPTILDRLASSNIHNYSIYRHGDLLFSYFEYTGDDYDADMAAIAADPETQRWWAIQEPLQRPVDDRAEGEWWKKLPEVFHTD